MKDSFDRLISRLNVEEEGTSELEDMSIEVFKTEIQRGKKMGPKNSRMSKNR